MSAPLSCAGCGREGELPKIRWEKVEPEPVVLRPRFDWHPDGRVALLCQACLAQLLERKQGKRRRVHHAWT